MPMNYNDQRGRLNRNEYYSIYMHEKIGISERDKEIVKKYMDGKTYSELAKEYGVTFNRIRKIVFKYIKRVNEVRTGEKTYDF